MSPQNATATKPPKVEKRSYSAAPGAMFRKADAPVLGEVLEKIGGPSGQVEPAQLVDASRPASSPTHHLFNWNDAEAAEAHRLHQARHHINHLRIRVVVDNSAISTRAFHSITVRSAPADPNPARRVYVATQKVLKDESMSAQAIDNAYRELEGWTRRHAEYASVFGSAWSSIAHALNAWRAKRGAAPVDDLES